LEKRKSGGIRESTGKQRRCPVRHTLSVVTHSRRKILGEGSCEKEKDHGGKNKNREGSRRGCCSLRHPLFPTIKKKGMKRRES